MLIFFEKRKKNIKFRTLQINPSKTLTANYNLRLCYTIKGNFQITFSYFFSNT